VQNVCQSSWNNLRKFIFSFDHMTSGFQCPSVYRQTTDCTEGGGLTREHCICNNFTISQFLCPSRFKSTTSCFRSSLSSFDLRPILKTCLFICKCVADDLQITSHIWGKFKRVTQDSLKLCSSFYYNEKHWWQFQLALPIAAIFLFSRILMRQHCTRVHVESMYMIKGFQIHL